MQVPRHTIECDCSHTYDFATLDRAITAGGVRWGATLNKGAGGEGAYGGNEIEFNVHPRVAFNGSGSGEVKWVVRVQLGVVDLRVHYFLNPVHPILTWLVPSLDERMTWDVSWIIITVMTLATILALAVYALHWYCHHYLHHHEHSD